MFEECPCRLGRFQVMLSFPVSGKPRGDIVSDEIKLGYIEPKGKSTSRATEVLPVETGSSPIPSGA